jgi:hypothetical protein
MAYSIDWTGQTLTNGISLLVETILDYLTIHIEEACLRSAYGNKVFRAKETNASVLFWLARDNATRQAFLNILPDLI